jgi:hypothetical protein
MELVRAYYCVRLLIERRFLGGTMKFQSIWHFAAALLITLVWNPSGVSAAPGTAKPGEGTGRGRLENDNASAGARTVRARAEMNALATRLKLTQRETLDFFRAERNRPEADQKAWTELLELTVPKDATDVAAQRSADLAAETVSNLIQIRKATSKDDLSINEVDLLAVHKNWTPTQKQNFAKVLAKAKEVASSGKVSSADEAFQKSIEELGYKDKLASCRR